jgi:hypothetical protein
MADTKISALPASSTPLAGTEVLPIVQSSATKQVSVANLTAGRAISATQLTLTTGSVIVANGQGIDFSATPGTGTSELFADYEEGTWTGVVTGSTTAPLTPNSSTGTYTKVGRQVTVTLATGLKDLTGAVGFLRVTGLPFTPAVRAISTYFSFQLSLGGYPIAVIFESVSTVYFYYTVNNADWQEQPIAAAGGKNLYITMTYFV